MRKPLILAALALAAPALPDDGLVKIRLRVGEQRALGGHAPICDDPGVAVISAEGAGVLRAVGPGKTLCSLATLQGGTRQVYEVTVTAPESEPAGPSPARGGG
jgi:hypothetical protein